MVLQTFNKNLRGSKASSLYCVWVRKQQKPGAPLECVWIDSEMAAFERQFVPGNEAEATVEQDTVENSEV
jgi:hypothetical protein